MKTSAELKRDCNEKKISVEMIYRYGEEIPERLKGIRKATRANTVGVFFATAAGQESELSIKAASLIEYDTDTLTIYQAGKRQPTEQEQAILDLFKKEQAEYIAQNPYCEPYWHKVAFFRNHKAYEYLAGFETIRGKKYNTNDNTITDNTIKGEKIIQYKVYHI